VANFRDLQRPNTRQPVGPSFHSFSPASHPIPPTCRSPFDSLIQPLLLLLHTINHFRRSRWVIFVNLGGNMRWLIASLSLVLCQAWAPSNSFLSSSRQASTKLFQSRTDYNVVFRPSTDSDSFDSLKIGSARVHRYSDPSSGIDDTEYIMWYHARDAALNSPDKSLPLVVHRPIDAVGGNCPFLPFVYVRYDSPIYLELARAYLCEFMSGNHSLLFIRYLVIYSISLDRLLLLNQSLSIPFIFD
jgi:hypothetical protein